MVTIMGLVLFLSAVASHIIGCLGYYHSESVEEISGLLLATNAAFILVGGHLFLVGIIPRGTKSKLKKLIGE